MSLINQVLSDLERRGVNALPGESSIRAVPVRRNLNRLAWLIAAILILAVAAGLWWNSLESKTSAPMRVVPAPAKPVAVPQAESQPVIVATQDFPLKENQQQGGEDTGGPAMRLSFELSTIPLPSSLRAKPVAAATGQNHIKVAPPAYAIPATESKAPVVAPVSGVVPAGSVDKQIRQASTQQQPDNEFRRASGLMQQDRVNEAIAGYEAVLQLDAGHDAARQAMLGLLLENKRNADAERVLQDGLKHNPRQSGFAMLLARLQVERDALSLALDTLQKTLPYAYQQADYQAFIAALLQRQNRHNEAISRYQIALQLSPNSGVWLMGLGISMQAVQRNEEARDAFRRAIESRTLSAELQAFVEQRLKEL